MLGRLLGNPYALLALWCFGLVCGALPAWNYQAVRLDVVAAARDKAIADHKAYVATVTAQGVAAKKLADMQAQNAKRIKENSDHAYQTAIARLNSDVRRLRDDRSRTSYVPAAPAGSGRADLACFDRAELERALQHLDAGLSGLIAEGDADAVGLSAVRDWANQLNNARQ